jgi:hypothetical protein
MEDEARKNALEVLAGVSPFVGTFPHQTRCQIYKEVREIIEEKWSMIYQEPPWCRLLRENTEASHLISFFVGSVFKTMLERTK